MRDRSMEAGLVHARDLERLGAGFSHAFVVDDAPCFGELLLAIDNADQHRADMPRNIGRSKE